MSIGIRRWLDRLLPPVCVVCGRPVVGERAIACGLCWVRAPEQRYPRCSRCGIALPDLGVWNGRSGGCTDCADWLPYLREARAPYVMEGVAARLVHALKYGGWRQLADTMGMAMSRVPFSASVESEIKAAVPVPLSATRLRERGFNQAALLASAVARRRSWRVADALVRLRDTRSQARLEPASRAANVAGAFGVDARWLHFVRGAHLALVDDVLTTGHTARDCVRALCTAGARAVSVLTFARARPDSAF